jgi:hypothetical protein
MKFSKKCAVVMSRSSDAEKRFLNAAPRFARIALMAYWLKKLKRESEGSEYIDTGEVLRAIDECIAEETEEELMALERLAVEVGEIDVANSGGRYER